MSPFPLARSLPLVSLLLGALQGSRPSSPGLDPRHETWTSLLGAFVRAGVVDYGGLRGRSADLDSYLAELRAIRPEAFEALPRADRLAYWINAYNAFTVRLVLDHYPVKSIKDVGGVFRSVFKKEFIELRNLRRETLSLDDVEHGILRPEFADPRVHFAIVCASKGCPPLRSEAYRAADLEAQLDDQARRFLADPGKNRIALEDRALHLSPIFKWFREDFEKASGSVPRFLARFLDAKRAAAIGDGKGFDVDYLDYDWTLNGK
ncbi:MAG TPA: DUF547 domain-containing protein [Planctomycetota bacterium]|jgi:hypothetical protein|nr:DUF547 domain-containing protein [Planctomycetota bacterium]